MNAVISKLLINYETIGRGKEILLIHGWGDDCRTFSNIAAALAKKYKVITLDLPGFGGSQLPYEVWGLDEYATFIQEFITKLNIKTFAIIGHSNGGSIAIRGLSQKILTSDKLILLSSAGIRSQQNSKRLVLKIIAKTGKVMTFWLPFNIRKKLQYKLHNVAGSDLKVMPQLQDSFKQIVRQDVQRDAEKIDIPTLILYGEDDKATPPHYGEIFRNLIKNSKLIILPNAAHFIHHDQPQIVIDAAEKFLDE